MDEQMARKNRHSSKVHFSKKLWSKSFSQLLNFFFSSLPAYKWFGNQKTSWRGKTINKAAAGCWSLGMAAKGKSRDTRGLVGARVRVACTDGFFYEGIVDSWKVDRQEYRIMLDDGKNLTLLFSLMFFCVCFCANNTLLNQERSFFLQLTTTPGTSKSFRRKCLERCAQKEGRQKRW